MKKRLLTSLNVVALGLAAALMAPALADDRTEDILHMLDGRALHGQILDESSTEVVFEVNVSGIVSKITLSKSEIGRIERDVVLEGAEEEKSGPRPTRSARPTSRPDDEDDEPKRSYGARRMKGSGDAPSFYVIPMQGQMGTDVNVEVYEQMIDDIRAADPDYIVIDVDCADNEETLFPTVAPQEGGFVGSEFLDMYRDVVNFFHDELRDYKQVAFVRDSVGISSVLVLSWDSVFMTPEARLGGLRKAAANFEAAKADADKYGKFREAYMGWLKGYVENSDHDLLLVDAMVRPEMRLSATWKGRDVDWSLNNVGEYIVDNNEEETVNFSSRMAENFCISSGTAEDYDDLALLIGLREYQVLDSAGEEIFEKHVEDWRRAWDQTKDAFGEYRKITELGLGSNDPVQNLGKQRTLLQRILGYMERYDAVRVRALFDYGVTKLQLQVRIDLIKEQLRAARRGGRDGGRGGRRPPGGGAGAGG